MRLKLTIFAALMASTSFNTLADSHAYRVHLVNAQAHIKQAMQALNMADKERDQSIKYFYQTSAGNRTLNEVLGSIDHYLNAPLQPNISPEIFKNHNNQ